MQKDYSKKKEEWKEKVGRRRRRTRGPKGRCILLGCFRGLKGALGGKAGKEAGTFAPAGYREEREEAGLVVPLPGEGWGGVAVALGDNPVAVLTAPPTAPRMLDPVEKKARERRIDMVCRK